MNVKADKTLDLQGLKCPLPTLLTKRALQHSPSGNIIEVICDDPLAHLDVPHMCRQENIEILHELRRGDVVHLWLSRR